MFHYVQNKNRQRIAKETLEKLEYHDIVDLGPMEDSAKTMNRKMVSN